MTLGHVVALILYIVDKNLRLCRRNQRRRTRRGLDCTFEHAVLGTDFLSIHLLVCVVVWPQCGAFERNAPNSPFAREHVSTSAFKATSVSADAVRPKGPAAAEAYRGRSSHLVHNCHRFQWQIS